LEARLRARDRSVPRVCVCVCGSVAAVKLPELVHLLLAASLAVDVVLTDSAARFMRDVAYNGARGADALAAMGAREPRRMAIWRDADEWAGYATVGADPVLHIELAQSCDALLFAPLDANTLAKAALGLADNLASCVLRAWPYDLADDPADAARAPKPVLVAPAMNTAMWRQRVTGEHLETLRARGVVLVPPVSKKLACGDTGSGAMEAPAVIVAAVLAALGTGERRCQQAGN
jgi:phosphopantothenoylcysteine decarboxylase